MIECIALFINDLIFCKTTEGSTVIVFRRLRELFAEIFFVLGSLFERRPLAVRFLFKYLRNLLVL